MERISIKNRKGQKIVVLLEKNDSLSDVIFIVHGLSGFKEQPHIEISAQAFKEQGFTVIRFDTTNTFGESDGEYKDATVTSYLEDLEDVIAWTKIRKWFRAPYWLTGHSLGGMAVTLFAEEHPNEVRALAPISPVVSGELSVMTHGQEMIEKWRSTGWREEISSSRPGVVKRLPWSHMEDRLKYDLLKDAKNLTMPVLLIVGSDDATTPVSDQKLLFNALPDKKELKIVDGARHTFKEEGHLEEVKDYLTKWIRQNNHTATL